MQERAPEVLAFAAEHDFVTSSQVGVLLGGPKAPVAVELTGLVDQGLLLAERPSVSGTAVYRITRAGLDAIGSKLPVPSAGLDRVRHAIGVVWLWVAATDGAFGPNERVLSRRRMECLDRAGPLPEGELPFGVAVEGSEEPGVLSYPDVMLVLPQGRVAMYQELGFRPREELERLLPAVSARSYRVLFMVDDLRVGEGIRAVAKQLGLSRAKEDLPGSVMVQRIGSIAD